MWTFLVRHNYYARTVERLTSAFGENTFATNDEIVLVHRFLVLKRHRGGGEGGKSTWVNTLKWHRVREDETSRKEKFSVVFYVSSPCCQRTHSICRNKRNTFSENYMNKIIISKKLSTPVQEGLEMKKRKGTAPGQGTKLLHSHSRYRVSKK